MKMVEVKTAELIGPALDWAVAYHLNGDPVFFEAFGPRVHGRRITTEVANGNISPSTKWAQCGPLIDKFARMIERSGQPVQPDDSFVCLTWCDATDREGEGWGQTTLIAACRAIVAAHSGDVVSVPAELMGPPK